MLFLDYAVKWYEVNKESVDKEINNCATALEAAVRKGQFVPGFYKGTIGSFVEKYITKTEIFKSITPETLKIDINSKKFQFITNDTEEHYIEYELKNNKEHIIRHCADKVRSILTNVIEEEKAFKRYYIRLINNEQLQDKIKQIAEGYTQYFERFGTFYHGVQQSLLNEKREITKSIIKDHNEEETAKKIIAQFDKADNIYKPAEIGNGIIFAAVKSEVEKVIEKMCRVVKGPFTVKQTAEILGMSTAQIKRYCDSGVLEAKKLGERVWAIDEDSILRHIEKTEWS